MEVTGDLLSWIFGNISTFLWLFVFLPSLYKNYKLQSSTAISFSLIFLWLIGDIFSVLSAESKDLENIIIYIGIFHIIFDIIFMIQILYYRKKLNIFRVNSTNPFETDSLLEQQMVEEDQIRFIKLSKTEMASIIFFTLVLILFKIILLYLPHNSNNSHLVADIIAWFSTFIFMVSRIPQLLLNYRRKSVVGLSLISFIIIIFANWFFVASILIKLVDIQKEKYIYFIINNLQWIIGGLITTLSDILILIQFIVYKQMKNENEN